MMLDLDEIERRANAATPGPWYVHESDRPGDYWTVSADEDSPFECEVFDDGSAGGEYGPSCSIADRDFLVAARADVPALIARVRELEEECERMKTFAAQNFSQMIRQEAEQMRAYGLSYEGVRKVLHEYNDGEISFGKLMDLIRAAARAMAEDEVRERRAKATEGFEEPSANVVTAGDMIGLRRKE